jgi:hypothetical protein
LGDATNHIVVTAGDSKRVVKRAEYVKEEELRTLIQDSPELFHALGTNLTFIPVGREVSVGQGRVDLVFVDSDGLVTLVETKLRANYESRREVVGQVLEYAAHASLWTLEDVERMAAEFYSSAQAPQDLSGATFDSVADSFLQADRNAEQASGPTVDELRSAITASLAGGHLRVVVGIDEDVESLERIVRYVSRHSDLQVVLMQVSRFRIDDERSVLIPSLIGDVPETHPRIASTRITRLGLVESFLDPKEQDAVESLLSVAEEAGAVLEFGSSGLSIRVRCPAREQPVSVAWFFPPGQGGWLRTKDLSFGWSLVDMDGVQPVLRGLLSDYHAAFEADGIGREASSKGVEATSLTAWEVSQHITRICDRLQRVVRECAELHA